MTIEQLTAALMAYDPLLCRQALANEEPSWGRVQAILDKLHEQRPGLQWAVVDTEDCTAQVYEDLIEAAEAYDPEKQFMAACKTEDGMLYLRMDGKWTAIDTFESPESFSGNDA
jgi:hypothetical protein